MSFKRLIFTFGTLALALAAGPLAQAQECKTTADCHKGFVCVTYTAKPEPTPPPATAPSGPATPAIDPTAPAKTSALIAPQSGYCQAAPCAADSECGPNMVCHTETIGTCAGGGTAPACPANTDCGVALPIAPPPTCTEEKISRCAFTWQLPCNTDTECGAGFMCTPVTTGSCSSSGSSGGVTPTMGGTAPSAGTGTPSSGAAVPADLVAPQPPDRNCTTTTSFPGYCQPKATACASNTDCPMDFTCTAAPSPNTGSPVSTRPASSGAAGTAGTTMAETAPADAFVPPGVPVTPTTMTCTSPYYGYGARAEDASGGGTTTTGGGPPILTGNGGTAGAGGGPLPPQSPMPTHEKAGTGSSMPTGGCAVGGGSSSLALAALALLGLVIARRRR